MSSKEQEQEGYSLQAQERFLREYCNHAGLNAVKYFHISESASKADQRKTFNEAMTFLKKQGILHFVCEKVDRLLRNFKDAVMAEEWLDADEARRLHAPKNSLVLHKNSASQEKLIWGIHVVMAKNYTDNLREEVRKGMLEKLRQGWLPGVPPLGYTNVRQDGKTIQRLSDDAPLVLRLFKLAATGTHTLSSLSEKMAELGLMRNGRPISTTIIYRILHNPYYTGVLVWQGKTYVGRHDPIVSKSLFDEVQEAIAKPLKQFPKRRRHRPLFKGLVVCSFCGGLLVWEVQKGHWYGKCPKSRACTRQRYVRQEVLEDQVAELLRALKAPRPRLAEWIRTELEATLEAELGGQEAVRGALKLEEEKLQARLSVLYDDRLEGRITSATYDAKAASIHAQQADINNRLNSLATEKGPNVDEVVSFVELTQSAATEFQRSPSIVRKRELIAAVFGKLTLSGEQLDAQYNHRAEWLLTGAIPHIMAENDQIEPVDSGSIKRKRDPLEVPHSVW